MNNDNGRRHFMQTLAATAMLPVLATTPSLPVGKVGNPSRLKISLNAFSFNASLTSGTMTIDDMIDFCAAKGFMAVDITAYYFKGYPAVPDDDYLYHIKRKAFRESLEISGTGVRNDFTEPDPIKRKQSVKLVKLWIEAAEKLGAAVIRIFAGNQPVKQYSREQVLEWMMTDIRECVSHGEKHGVVVAIQNHDDFIKTADQAIQIIDGIKSEWFGLILDTGSYRTNDAYQEIEKTARYAVNWQIKEKIYVSGKEVDVDLDRLIKIIKASGYKGYLPLETLGEGDPKLKISALFDKVTVSLAKT